MGLKSFEILLDNPWSTYYTGQTVTGRVILSLDSLKRARGLLIRFKGEASTSWFIEESTTNNEGKQENDRIELTGNEEYFKTSFFLIGGQGGEIEIPPGEHVYPFTCVLPPTLPSSFEGDFGYIRYTIKALVDRPWKFDHEAKRAFTVLFPVDLNVNPKLKEPVRITLEKFFCCCWCRSGPLTCRILLPCSGFVPGQVIPAVVEVDNISNVEISGVQFTFQKVITYKSQSPRRDVKKDIKIITEIKVGGVAPHGSNTWNQPITIPSIPPSNLTNCTLIDIDYELKVEVNVSGLHTNLESRIPITIGTVPFTSSYTTGNASAPNETVINVDEINNPQAKMGWVANGKDASETGIYPTVPLFEASQFGTDSIQDKNDDKHMLYFNNSSQYSPMYPIYNNGK